jgi:small subunit ribosomal protein S1
MSEMSFEQMLEESFKTIRNGEVVEGTVIDVKPDEIFLNIGYKSDGIITRNEYTNEPNVDLTTVVKVGDKMEAKVVKLNDGEGQVILSYKRLQAEKGSKRLEEAFENQEVLKAKVTQVLAGGVCVSVDETRVFIPASLVSDTYEKDLNKFKDQEIEFIITEFDPRKRRIIGNRKVLLVEQKAKQQEELLANLHVGDVIEGTVKNVTDFGAFIDLGGVDGLLHISEMSWGRVENPKKVFTVGQTVRVFVKNINGSKIALSMKFDDENPWNGATEKFAPGNIVKGKVARMTDFGAFIELAPGVDALLHVSQISKDHVKNINGSKIALSMKFDDENPWNGATEKFAPGNIVKGKVARMTDFGAFIELAPGVDALLHVSQISKDHVEKPSDVLKIGQEVEAKVVEFNEDDKKISLSMKALLDSEDDGADVADVNIDEVASDNE